MDDDLRTASFAPPPLSYCLLIVQLLLTWHRQAWLHFRDWLTLFSWLVIFIHFLFSIVSHLSSTFKRKIFVKQLVIQAKILVKKHTEDNSVHLEGQKKRKKHDKVD